MSTPVAIAARIVLPFAGVINCVRPEFPGRLFQDTGRIGGDLMCITVFRERHKWGIANLPGTLT